MKLRTGMWSQRNEEGRRVRARDLMRWLAAHPGFRPDEVEKSIADWFRGEWARATHVERRRQAQRRYQ